MAVLVVIGILVVWAVACFTMKDNDNIFNDCHDFPEVKKKDYLETDIEEKPFCKTIKKKE